jgi:hypothetical protein
MGPSRVRVQRRFRPAGTGRTGLHHKIMLGTHVVPFSVMMTVLFVSQANIPSPF